MNLMDAESADENYAHQLAALKSIVPQLTRAQDVHLCALWIERFNRCDGKHDRQLRNVFMCLLIDQLHGTGSLQSSSLFGEPCNVNGDLTALLTEHYEPEAPAQMPASDNSEISTQDYRVLYEECHRKYTQNEQDLRCERRRVQSLVHGLRQTIVAIDAKMANVTQCNRSALADVGELLLHGLWSKCLPIDVRTGLERVARKWTQLAEEQRRSAEAETEPVKYKRFALKSAAKIKRLQAELNATRRDQAIRASSESIRQAAWRTEWMFGADARQQAELSGLLDKLDGRCRELLLAPESQNTPSSD